MCIAARVQVPRPAHSANSHNPAGHGLPTLLSGPVCGWLQVPSNHDSISLLAPFVVWGILICILYTVGFVVLRDVRGPMSLISTHNVAVVRMVRESP